jgi:hypothetical protein
MKKADPENIPQQPLPRLVPQTTPSVFPRFTHERRRHATVFSTSYMPKFDLGKELTREVLFLGFWPIQRVLLDRSCQFLAHALAILLRIVSNFMEFSPSFCPEKSNKITACLYICDPRYALDRKMTNAT